MLPTEVRVSSIFGVEDVLANEPFRGAHLESRPGLPKEGYGIALPQFLHFSPISRCHSIMR